MGEKESASSALAMIFQKDKSKDRGYFNNFSEADFPGSPTSDYPNNHQLEVEIMSAVGFRCGEEMGTLKGRKTLMVV